jgi:hypothetical protein
MPTPCSNAPTEISIEPRKAAVTASLSVNEFTIESAIATLGESDAAMARDAHELLARFGIVLNIVADGESIPGTFWGEPEAGLIGVYLYARADTPVHSVLHEACHYICMTPDRRRDLATDAGGDYDEENAVCYLQILIADQLTGVGRDRMFADMDAWGYTFRLGSARAWFEQDADDARQWLEAKGLALNGRLQWVVRGENLSASGIQAA